NERASLLSYERHALKQQSAELNERVRQLRDSESVSYDPVVPGFSSETYRGTLRDIVREVKRLESRYDWMPAMAPNAPDVPPLSHAEFMALRRLIGSDTRARRLRFGQVIPSRGDLP